MVYTLRFVFLQNAVCFIILIYLVHVLFTFYIHDHYSGRTAPLTPKRCILYIYSTNKGNEYFKHGIHSPFCFSSKCSLFHNSNVFGSCIIHILYTGVLKLKKIIPASKGYISLLLPILL